MDRPKPGKAFINKSFLLSVFLFTSLFTIAQDSVQVDLIDVGKNILKKGTPPRKDTIINDKGKTHFSLLPAAGYTLQTGFAGVVSGNAAFFINKHNHEGNISTVLASIAYTSRRQTIVPIESSIWTKRNEYNIVTDWRYLQYPSETFGLGGHSSMDNEYTLNFNYLKLHQAVLKKLQKDLYAGIGYDLDYFWNIVEVNPPPGKPTDFETYGFYQKEKASGISLNFLYDSRRNPINPQKGLFANIILRPKFVFMGSDANWQSLLVEMRTYQKFPSGSGNILAFWSYNWLTLGGKPPYLLLPSTGWDEFSNTGRGYIQGRFRSRNMLDQEAEYRFMITANGLLGGVVFVTAQSFSDMGSNKFEVISPGAGFGIRVKLNKFSGTNVALDYAFGTQGSRGFFVNLGEVF